MEHSWASKLYVGILGLEELCVAYPGLGYTRRISCIGYCVPSSWCFLQLKDGDEVS